MSVQTELTTMTGAEAYAKAVEYANKAAEHADKNPNSAAAHQLAAVSRAFSGIAQAEATARASAKPGYLPGGGWARHTDPDDPRFS
jgi:hypothetical protein